MPTPSTLKRKCKKATSYDDIDEEDEEPEELINTPKPRTSKATHDSASKQTPMTKAHAQKKETRRKIFN